MGKVKHHKKNYAKTIDMINRYIFRQTLFATIFVAVCLTCAVWLTQILRFLELIIDAGAPFSLFFQLLLLTIPRFLEFTLPISTLIALTFVYAKLIADNEIIILKAAGWSNYRLSRPAITLFLCLTVFGFTLSGWLTPISHAKLQELRQEIQSSYSGLLVREGVFNNFGDGVTIYVEDKQADSVFNGLLIHQAQRTKKSKDDKGETIKSIVPASTVIAKRGKLIQQDGVFQLLVQEGSQQQRDIDTGYVSRLDFDQYSVDITPDKKKTKNRHVDFDEMTLTVLYDGLVTAQKTENDTSGERAIKYKAEIHKRLSQPFLLFGFVIACLSLMLGGTFTRRGGNGKIIFVGISGLALQGGWMFFLNLAKDDVAAIYGLYLWPVFVALLGLLYMKERA